MELSIINSHPRDKLITFEEVGHKYKINGVELPPISVTTLAGNFWEKFDTISVSARIVKSNKMLDSSYKYYGMSQDEIITLWSSNNAAVLGTEMHLKIELYYEGKLQEHPNTHEFSLFLKFHEHFQIVNPGYSRYRTEWVIYDKFGKVAGSIDMTFINILGHIVIFDWKRVEKLDDWYRKYGKGPLSHMKDTKFNHYVIQLNCYRHILETCYNKIIVGMYLGVFHPNNPGYIVREVPRMEEEINNIWATLRD